MNIFSKVVSDKAIFYVLFIFILSNSFGYSQSLLRNDIIPHTPEAEALSKFVTTPVTLYSGSPAVSIPVYEIKSSKLTLPITLSYNYNGYRPNEEATWVGLGWSLSGGGAITRVVKGLVDHVPGIPTAAAWYDDYLDIVTINAKQDFLTKAGTGYIDPEPDLYIFNFNSHSGKFIWVNGKAIMFPMQDLVISKTGSIGNETFTITTEDGSIYTFDARETTYHGHTDQNAEWIPQHTSAWFLTKIQSSDKTDAIDFSYSTYNYTQPLTFVDKYQVQSANGSPGNNTSGHTYIYTEFRGSSIQGQQLSQITSKTSTITFEAESTVRQDLLNNTSKALKTIHVYDNTSLLKNITLIHNYFSGTSLTGTRPTKLNLKEVDISSFPIASDGTVFGTEQTFAKYLLQYQNETGNFAVQTKGIDYWGYYNGANINASLFPTGFISPALPVLGNRNPDLTSCSNGILNKITYPTKGYTTFNYELNVSTTQSGSTQSNTSQVIVPFNASLGDPTTNQSPFTLQTNQTISVGFGRVISGSSYPNGVLNNLYILQIYTSAGSLVYSCPKLGKSGTDGTASVALNAGNYYYKVTCENTSLSSYGNVTYTTSATSTTTVPKGGMRVYRISSYDNIDQAAPAVTKNYIYSDDAGNSYFAQLSSPGMRIQEIDHATNPYSVDQYYTYDFNSSLNGLLDAQFYYSSVSEINNSTTQSGKTKYDYINLFGDADGVVLKKQTEYKYSGSTLIPIKTIDNNYDVINKNITTAFKSVMYQDGNLLTNPDYDDPTQRTQVYKVDGLYTLVSRYKLLNNTVVTSYDQNGANPLTIQTNYYYDNPLHQLATRKTETNSKGETVTTQIIYPLDYNFAGCASPASIESAFNTDYTNTVNTYNSCVVNRNYALTNYGGTTDLHPYYPNTVANQTNFSSVVGSYPCETNFKSQSATAFTNRSNSYAASNTCLNTTYTNSSIPYQKAILLMQKNHIISPVIEQYSIINKSGTDYLTTAMKTDYKVVTSIGGYDVAVPSIIYTTELNNSLLKSTFVSSPSTYYKTRAGFAFDNNINLTEQHKNTDVSTSYLWDYNNLYPVAEIINAATTDIFAYTSFEADSKGGFAFSGVPIGDLTAPTGKKFYPLSSAGSITKSVSSSVSYIVSLWSNDTGPTTNVTVNSAAPTKYGRSINGWTYREWKITGQSTATINCTGTRNIDELRLYPAAAQMNTFTYSPARGLTTKCDINSGTSYYVYDCLDRLQVIKDQNKNVLKRFCYNYIGQPIDCGSAPAPKYENNLLSTNFTRNNCGGGFTPGIVAFVVKPGTYTSTISQADADQQAVNYTNANGQNYANANGTCTPIVSVNLTSTNFIGVTGFNAVYTNVSTGQQTTFAISSRTGPRALGTINNGTYNITISKAGNTISYVYFLGNCNGIITGGTSGTFNNIVVGTSTCNNVSIDVN